MTSTFKSPRTRDFKSGEGDCPECAFEPLSVLL